MIDDTIDAAKPAKLSTASFYDVLAPDSNKPPTASRQRMEPFLEVLVKGNHVEHWLQQGKVWNNNELRRYLKS